MNEVQILREAIDKKLQEAMEKITKIQKDFVRKQAQLNLLQSNIELITSLTSFKQGSRNCWKRGYFLDGDIREGYDVRRPITDSIIEFIDSNTVTILYGDPYHGKSITLKRIMFEEIDNGYAVLFVDVAQLTANANQLVGLLALISEDYQKILFIADNVHKAGGEEVFAAFSKCKSPGVRFLFAARKDELYKNTLTETAFENIPPTIRVQRHFRSH